MRGRDRFLTAVAGSGSGVLVVHGMGGCGKTRFALETAREALSRGTGVWWISAAEQGGLEAGMRALGRRLGLADADLGHGDAADLIWRRLAGHQESWLLVFDNADDPHVLAGAGNRVAEGRGWLRPVAAQGPGMVLVTSRDGSQASWGPWCARYRLGMLAAQDAVAVLADYAGHRPEAGSAEDRRRLAMRLGGLPLALKIAGSYLAESARRPAAFAGDQVIGTYRQYQDALDAGQLGAVFPAGDGELTEHQARTMISRTWDLTLDLLESRLLPEARWVLRLLATFAGAPVPYQLLRLDTLAAWPPLAGVSGPRLWRVLRALEDFGLIDLASACESPDTIPAVRLHPLVRDTSVPPAGSEERIMCLNVAARLLQAAADAGQIGWPGDPASWPAWQVLAPHVAHVLAEVSAVPQCPNQTARAAAGAADVAAGYLTAQGIYAQAQAQCQQVLAVWLRLLGPDHPDTLRTRFRIAWTKGELEDHAGAQAEFRDVLAAALRVLGPDHPVTLAARHHIGRAMAGLGDHAAAEAEYREVLAAAVRVLGPDAQLTLMTRHCIAVLMAQRGEYAGAEAEFRDVLAAKLRVLGPHQLSTLYTWHEIAAMRAQQGDHAGAAAEYRDVLASKLRLLGPHHRSTLHTSQHLDDLERQRTQ